MASASIRSDLPRTRPRRRSGAVNLGGTRTSRCRAASSVRSSPRVTCRQSSTAHSRRRPTRFDQETSSSPSLVSSAVELPADLVDSHSSQRVLVHVHSDHDHLRRLLPLGATGERTDLNRGSCQAPIRSRSTVSGRRRRHNTGKSAHRRHSESSQPPPPRVFCHNGQHPPRMTLSSGMSPEPRVGAWGRRLL